jgi:hypothetical protein
MRTDGAWISDSNYAETGKTIIPLGTPVKVTGYGRNRVHIDIQGKKQAFGNDYSRDIPLEAFGRRYVVQKNPMDSLAAVSAKVKDAVTSARVTKGMSRDQVLMALGYPISSENPNLDAKVWRYWLWSFSPYQITFDEQGMVSDVDADKETKPKVYIE